MPMTWTMKAPADEGYYWVRCREFGESSTRLAEAIRNDDGKLMLRWGAYPSWTYIDQTLNLGRITHWMRIDEPEAP